MQEAHIMLKEHANVQSHSLWDTYHFSLTAGPAYILNLTRDFVLAKKMLPVEIKTERDAALYTMFFVSYGTGYLAHGVFGGRAECDVYVNSNYYHEQDYKWVFNQLSLSIAYKGFGLSGDYSGNKRY